MPEYNPKSHVYTVAQVAEILNLKPQTNGKWNGAPSGTNATKDGFILCPEGTAITNSGDFFTSAEVAELAGIAPNEYEPCVTFAASNGHQSNAPQVGKAPKTPKPKDTPQKPKAAVSESIFFDYHDADGNVLFRVNRKVLADGKKDFPVSRPNGRDGFSFGLGDTMPVLFELPKVRDAQTVFIVEGEKCATALNRALQAAEVGTRNAATTAPFGAGKWKKWAAGYVPELKDKRVFVLPDNDKPGEVHALQVLESVYQSAQSVAVLRLPDLPEKGDVADFLEAGETIETLFDLMASAPDWTPETPPENIFEFSTDSDLDSCLSEITWLWPGYIPNGFVSLIIGEQDTGKSTVAQDFCRTVICGGRWPDGTRCDLQADKLLWLDTEGSIALFRQRARAWKIPSGSFIFPRDPLQEIALDNDGDLAWIEAAIEHFKPPLVVVDSLSGGHGGEENSNGEMKAVLKRLSAIAQRHNIAILAVHHLSKPAPGVPDYPVNLGRARGAGAITQFCRSVLALAAPDPHNPTARRLDVIKLNIARKPAPVGYELTDDGPAWGKAPEPPKPRRAADDAVDWLRDAMAGGMRPSDEVRDEAAEAGIGATALKQAKAILGVKPQREGGKDGRWFLTLDNAPESEN